MQVCRKLTPVELTVEHIESNLQECMRRFDHAVNPTYEYHDFWDPLSQRIIPYIRLSRIEWWEEWKRAERMSPTVVRHPFKRLGELRAGTDDHAFNEGAKVIEDVLVQVSLLRKVLELHKRATGTSTPTNDKTSEETGNTATTAIEAPAATPLTRQAMEQLQEVEGLLDFKEEEGDGEDIPSFDEGNNDGEPKEGAGLDEGSDDPGM